MAGAVIGSPRDTRVTRGNRNRRAQSRSADGAGSDEVRDPRDVSRREVRSTSSGKMTAVGAGVMDILQNQEDRPEQRQQLM